MTMLIAMAKDTILLPAAVFLAILTLFRFWAWLLHRSKPFTSRYAAALTTAYLVAHIRIEGLPHFPPIAAEAWLPYSALAALFIGLLGTLNTARNSPSRISLVHQLARWLLPLALLWFWSASARAYQWSPSHRIPWIAALYAAIMLHQLLLTRAARTLRIRSTFVALTALCLIGAALLAGPAHCAALAQLQTVLAIPAALIVLLNGSKRADPAILATIPIFALLISFQWLSGYIYGDMPPYLAAALFLAPALLIIPRLTIRLSEPRA